MQKPYDEIGGALPLRALVNSFYDFVEAEPQAQPLLIQHQRGHGITHARQTLFEFLSGFLGGPALFFETHRHSNVKVIHAHLVITPIERDAWLFCMDKALRQQKTPEDLRTRLMQHFARVAEMLRNHD